MPPFNLLIKPASSLCNMRCSYCFYTDVAQNRTVPSYGIMATSTLELVVKKAFDYAENSCHFIFQGGEPTLAGLDFFVKLMELEQQYNHKGVVVTNAIQTNGYCLDETWAAFFAENKFLVGLSMDGTAELHDQYRRDSNGSGTARRVLRAARLLKEHNAEFNILCVVNQSVARHGKQVYQFFKKNGFRYLQFIPCLDGFDGQHQSFSLTAQRYADFLKTTFDLYYQDYKRGEYVSIRLFDNYVTRLMGYPPEHCGLAGSCSCNCVIEGDGSVYPCDFYVLDEYRLGTIQTDSFEDMIHSEAAVRFMQQSRYVDEKCRSCKWLNLCRGGCRRDREPFIDDKPSLNRFCMAYQQWFAYAYDRMCEMAFIERRRRGAS